MNDFTKDELEKILDAVEGTMFCLCFPGIYKKLRAMIENYKEPCNHQNLDTNICYRCGYGLGEVNE